MAKKEMNIWVLISLVVLVAVVASLVTVSITGNVTADCAKKTATLYENKPVIFYSLDGLTSYKIAVNKIVVNQARLNVNGKEIELGQGESYKIDDSATVYINKIYNSGSVLRKSYASVTFTHCQTVQIECKDSDGGLNYDVKGTVTWLTTSGTYSSLSEQCEGSKLYEYYCNGTLPAQIIYTCPNGCKDGACIVETGESGVTFQGVLNMLSKCRVRDALLTWNYLKNDSYMTTSCNSVCASGGQTCIDAMVSIYTADDSLGMYTYPAMAYSVSCDSEQKIGKRSDLLPGKTVINNEYCTCCSA
jgi:hypothetical protein